MPQIFRVGSYAVYFWSNMCNNNYRIPDKVLKNIMRQIEANSEMILDRWREQFGEIRYYC